MLLILGSSILASCSGLHYAESYVFGRPLSDADMVSVQVAAKASGFVEKERRPKWWYESGSLELHVDRAAGHFAFFDKLYLYLSPAFYYPGMSS